MPTILGRSFSTDWRGKPPHMLKPDIPVWYRFLKEWAEHFISLYYDCQVGTAALTPDQVKDKMQTMWNSLTAKRIDAIAELENEVWIIEVAENPKMQALGQLLTYQTLWLEDPQIKKPVKLILVADKIDPALASSYDRLNIRVHLV